MLEILKALFIFLFSAGISCLRPLQGPLLSLAAHLQVTPWRPAQYILLHRGSYPETPSPEAPSSWRSRPSTAAGSVPPCQRSLPPPCWPFCCPTSSVKYLILSFFVCSLSMSFLLTVMYVKSLFWISFHNRLRDSFRHYNEHLYLYKHWFVDSNKQIIEFHIEIK